MNKSRKILLVAGVIVVALVLGIVKIAYDKSAPEIVRFHPVGQVINSDNITGIFVAAGKINISLDSQDVESTGVINYLLLPVSAENNTPYSLESLTFDPKKYAIYGGVTASNDGNRHIVTRDLESGGLSSLKYSEDNVLESVEHYNSYESSILQIYNGYYDMDNFYIDVEYDNPAGGTLCQIPLDGAKLSCYPHDMPTLYIGDFFVTDQRVYYSDDIRVSVKSLVDNSLSQVGVKFDKIGKGIVPAGGLLSYYKNNIYIAARLVNSDDAYMAVCHIPLVANHYKHWHCNYDPNIRIGNTSNITSFKIDLDTGNILVSISNYASHTAQMYSLPVSVLMSGVPGK